MKHSFLQLIVLIAIAFSLSSCNHLVAYVEFEKMKDSVCPDGDFRKSDLYKFLEFMPKGSDLHIHSGAMMPEEDYLQAKSGLTLSEFRDSLTMKARPDSVGQWDFFLTLYSPVYSYFSPFDESYFVVGFDFAQEEDKSRPLTDYSTLIKTTLQRNPKLKISLHAGESLLENNEEICSAIALGASRIGHSYNLYMHPELMSEMKERDICIESCPISNHTLGYCDDLFKHPVKDYIKNGLPVALCDDDPLFQEACPLTDDFFVAAYYLDLSLFQIKQLCKNSIHYSFLPDDRKETLMNYWKKEWKNYITISL